MADPTSLTYLLCTLLTLFAHDKPITKNSLRAEIDAEPPVTFSWNQDPQDYTVRTEIDSEPPVTFSWNQDPQDYTVRYDNEESCPPGEIFSECDGNCQTTCENVGEVVICPRMCIPGCVCDEPGTIRGPDGKCILPPLCPSKDEPPVTEDSDKWTLRDLIKDRRRPTIDPLAEQDPDDASYRRVTSVYPDEVEPVTYNVDPDEIDRAEQNPRIRVDPDDIDRAEQDPSIRINPDEIDMSEQDPRIPGNDDKCPKDEVMSMRRHCERTCSNWDRDKKLCPDFPNRGCVCKPNLVRGPNRRCIEIKNCPKESGAIHQEPQPGILRANRGCPNNDACTEYCKQHRGMKVGSCQGFQRMECLCFEHW